MQKKTRLSITTKKKRNPDQCILSIARLTSPKGKLSSLQIVPVLCGRLRLPRPPLLPPASRRRRPTADGADAAAGRAA